jgi:hypothetical protein
MLSTCTLLITSALAAPIDNALEDAQLLKEKLDAFQLLAALDGGFWEGPVDNALDQPGQAASWPSFPAKVTDPKYVAAGFETGDDAKTVADRRRDDRRHLEEQVETPTFGEALNNVGDSMINPFAPEVDDEQVRLTVLAHSDGCGNSQDDTSLIRQFFVDSRAEPTTFHWCPASGCDETLYLGGDTTNSLHYDFGMARLRGCPLQEGYTIAYLRLMKVLLGSFDTLYLGWGACN